MANNLMLSTLRQWGDWIATTPISTYLVDRPLIITVSQSTHIVSVTVIFASAMLICLRLLGVSASGRKVSELTNTLIPWMHRALAVLLLTGILQTIAEPLRQFMAAPFRWKMLLLVITVVFTLYFTRAVRAHAAQWDNAQTRPASAKALAIVWVGLWVAIIYCGRFIGYAYTG